MALHPHVVRIAPIITTVKTLAQYRAAVNGDLDQVYIKSDTNATGNITFDVEKNGVSIYTNPLNRPVVANGTSSISHTGLDFAVLRGDLITLKAVVVPSLKQIGGALEFHVDIEDNVAGLPGPTGPTGPTGPPGADGIFSAIASQAEAEAGTDNVKGMTPLRTAQAITALGGGGGGSSGIFSPDKAYASPSAEDDEFNAGSLDVKWTAVNGGSTVAFTIPNHMSMVPLGTAGQFHGYSQAFAGGVNRAWAMKFVPPKVMPTSGTYGLFIKSGSSEYDSLIYNSANQIAHEAWASTAAVGNFYSLQSTVFPAINRGTPIWFKLEYLTSGNGLKFYWSFDGINYVLAKTGATYFAAAPTHVGIFCNGTSTSDPCQVDWFRRLQGAYHGGNI